MSFQDSLSLFLLQDGEFATRTGMYTASKCILCTFEILMFLFLKNSNEHVNNFSTNSEIHYYNYFCYNYYNYNHCIMAMPKLYMFLMAIIFTMVTAFT
jgi:hypothetical protein